MRHIVVSEQSTVEDLQAALIALTWKAEHACIPSTLREIREDQDECIEMLAEAKGRVEA